MEDNLKKFLCHLIVSFATILPAYAAPQSHLDQVIANQVLRVCTTGDYKPYTYLKDDGTYEGIDISMAQALAKTLNAKVEFVPTSWKSLMADFLTNKCDIAMGGISISLARQQKTYLSEPVMVDGKIPFVRCQDVDKYQTLEQLNQSHIRAIEPAGGTNEVFVRNYMPKAQIELFGDNNTIFQNLVENKADVMITDASEALFQKRNYPSLCAVNAHKPLQFMEKAYMLPREDISWKLYVDQWLKLTQKNGEYDRYVGVWLDKD